MHINKCDLKFVRPKVGSKKILAPCVIGSLQKPPIPDFCLWDESEDQTLISTNLIWRLRVNIETLKMEQMREDVSILINLVIADDSQREENRLCCLDLNALATDFQKKFNKPRALKAHKDNPQIIIGNDIIKDGKFEQTEQGESFIFRYKHT